MESHWQRRIAAALLLGAALAVPGCTREDNDALARIGHKLADRAGVWIGEFKEYLDLDTSSGNSLESRVTNRLRWDKSLVDVAIEVKAKGSEIELNGVMSDPMLKQRAIDIVESTAGVEKVIDNLQILDLNPAPIPAFKENP